MTLQTQEDPSTAFTSRLHVSLLSASEYPNILYAHRDAADPVPLIHAIHERRMKAGVAISPDTPSTSISDEVGELADLLLVMTVYPGAGLLLFSLPFLTLRANNPQAAVARSLWSAAFPRSQSSARGFPIKILKWMEV
jgi:Ribulose-phosphate 3 epimerase family